MINELIFVTIALLDFTFIVIVSRLGKSWLYVAIVLNIILISIFGAKLVSIAGFTTNSGNIFYAAVFFAVQLLVERFGKEEGYKSIWLGVSSIIFFTIMSQFIVLVLGSPETQAVNRAMETLFHVVPRVAIASLFGLVFSQAVNIWLFTFIKSKSKAKFAWLRVNLSNLIGQALDSIIFFTIAFYGLLPFPIFIQALLAGYVLKMITGVLSTPFFYLSLFINRKIPEVVLENGMIAPYNSEEFLLGTSTFPFYDRFIQLIIFSAATMPILIFTALNYRQVSLLWPQYLFVMMVNLGLASVFVSYVVRLRKSNEALISSEKSFKSLVEGVKDYAIFMLDTKGRVITWNKGAELIKGYQASEIMGKHFSIFFLKEDRDNKKPDKVLEEATKKKHYTEEGWRIRKDGSKYWANALITPMVDKDGKLIGFSNVTKDLTNQKKQDEAKDKQLHHEIVVALQEKEFVSLASHQLLTPLALIIGYTSMIISGKLGNIDQNVKKSLKESLEGAHRMSNLVKSLLTTSRIESGNIKLTKTIFDLDNLVGSVAEELRLKLESKNLKIILPKSKKLLVRTDKEQARQILTNILDNAIKYTNKGQVIITMNTKNGMGYVSISDTGMGVDKQILPYIFRKFYMSKNGIYKKVESYGLGLYISKLLLDSMKGTITVESKKGEGSTFTIGFPTK